MQKARDDKLRMAFVSFVLYKKKIMAKKLESVERMDVVF